MIHYVVGNLFDSEAEALVNTVNCEGHMGKGIAYQFKLLYPQNNKAYVDACRKGLLKIGTLHYFQEQNKIIINFPTKDKWRAKSKIEYIDKGLNELVILIELLKIKSIAIPPLGSGNGGLIWSEVKVLIEQKLRALSNTIDIFIYEPSKNYEAKPKVAPELTLSALVLMNIKMNLAKFTNLRLQKTAYLMDTMNNLNYFHFKKHKFGPYDHSIDIISKNIKEFQDYYNVDTVEAYYIALNKQISKKIDEKLDMLLPIIKKTSNYVNEIENDKDLECITTILYILEQNSSLKEDDIIYFFKSWSKEKSLRYSTKDIENGIQYLYDTNLIEKNLVGFFITNNKKSQYTIS